MRSSRRQQSERQASQTLRRGRRRGHRGGSRSRDSSTKASDGGSAIKYKPDLSCRQATSGRDSYSQPRQQLR
jgi:hypothetical protein